MTEYGIFQYSGTRDYYMSSFCITVVNRDKLTNLDAKIIVLDGTGDIHPDYQDSGLVKMYHFGNFSRRLDGLTVKFVDFASGSSKLISDNDRFNFIMGYIETEYPEKDNTVIFSYK